MLNASLRFSNQFGVVKFVVRIVYGVINRRYKSRTLGEAKVDKMRIKSFHLSYCIVMQLVFCRSATVLLTEYLFLLIMMLRLCHRFIVGIIIIIIYSTVDDV